MVESSLMAGARRSCLLLMILLFERTKLTLSQRGCSLHRASWSSYGSAKVDAGYGEVRARYEKATNARLSLFERGH